MNTAARLTALATLASIAAATPVAAQMMHDHAGHAMPEAAALPKLPGDDTFGAIAEIVAMLRADPATDWTQVSIEALRQHLLDMDAVAKAPPPDSVEVEGGIEITIAGQDAGSAAARRMVPAHAPVLAEATGWTSQVEPAGDGLLWRVTGADAAAAAQIRALGFFGLLATGAHHQAHHLAMARGAGH